MNIINNNNQIMKKFNIPPEEEEADYIGNLLEEYSKSLSICSKGLLKGECKVRLNGMDRVVYEFSVKYLSDTSTFNSRTLFEITLSNLYEVKIVVRYFAREVEYKSIDISELEQKMDEIIESTEMGLLLGYLSKINKIIEKG